MSRRLYVVAACGAALWGAWLLRPAATELLRSNMKQSVPQLVFALRSEADPVRRLKVAEELARRGSAAVPLMLDCLAFPNAQEAFMSRMVLLRLPSKHLQQGAGRLLALHAAGRLDALFVLHFLKRLPETPEDALPLLEQLAASPDIRCRELAFEVLTKHGRHLPLVGSLAAHSSPATRLSAARALAACAAAPEERATLLSVLLQDPERMIRETAFSTLAACGRAATPFLLQQLRSSDAAQRVLAARAMHEVCASAPAEEQTLADLSTALQDSCPNVRFWAAAALAKSRCGDEAIVDALLSAMADSDPGVRWQAVAAVAHAQRPQAALLQALRQRQTDEDSVVRRQANKTLQLLSADDAIRSTP